MDKMAVGFEPNGPWRAMMASSDIPEAWIILPMEFSTREEVQSMIDAMQDAERRMRADYERSKP